MKQSQQTTLAKDMRTVCISAPPLATSSCKPCCRRKTEEINNQIQRPQLCRKLFNTSQSTFRRQSSFPQLLEHFR